MTNPSNAGASFGRTLQELFTVQPAQGRAPVLAGGALIEVPVLTDKEQAEAEQLVHDRRLTVRIQLVEAEGEPGKVKQQHPKAGEVVPAGSQVTLYVITARELSDLEKIRKVLDDVKVLTADNLVQALGSNKEFQEFGAFVRATYDDLLQRIGALATRQDVDDALQNALLGLPTVADLQAATRDLEQEDDARKRFEELKGLIRPDNGGGGGGTTPGKTRT